MTQVDLVLQPAAHRSRSMGLYAERLAENQPADQDWQIRRLPSLPGNIGYRIAEIAFTPPAVYRLSGDVVHVLDHAHAAYARYARAPVVVTVHDLIPLKWMQGAYPTTERISRIAAMWFRWNMRALTHARHLVTPSKATAGELARLLGLHNTTVVPNGVDAVFYDSPVGGEHDARGEHKVPPLRDIAGPVLLQVTSTRFYKNNDAFRAVFLDLAEKIKGLTWVRVGAPLSEADHRALNTANRTTQVVELSGISTDMLAAVYRRANCLLFPSLDEGFGWPPLEAMASGCPVVSSAQGALAETSAPAALTADPHDHATLAAHVHRVLTDPTLAADLTQKGHAHAAHYHWSGIATQMAQIYAEAAK